MSLSIAVSVLRHVFSFDQEMITSLLIRCTIMYTMLDLTEFGDQSRNALCLRRRGHADQPYRNLFLSSWFVMQQITWFIVFVEMYHFHALLWFYLHFPGGTYILRAHVVGVNVTDLSHELHHLFRDKMINQLCLPWWVK